MLKFKYLLFLSLAVLVLSACAQKAASPTQPVATEAGDAHEQVVISPTPDLVSSSVASSETITDTCLACHGDKQMLSDTASPAEEVQTTVLESSRLGVLLPMEAWERVLVDKANFPTSIHGLNGCISCHGGAQSAIKEEAHTGMISNPSADPQAVCGQCHPNIAEHSEDSLHASTEGFWNAIEDRSIPADHPALEEGFQTECTTCHTTCGDCHVSRPAGVGGGFTKGHIFTRTPLMTQTCTVCHANPVGNEFTGMAEGEQADVHYTQGGMTCTSCHKGAELHGEPADCQSCHPGPESSQLPPPEHRYDGAQTPGCESCHAAVATAQDEVLMHQMHGSKLSCQVCHATAYTSGDWYAGGELLVKTFLIGRNPIQTYARPYEYVLLRELPFGRDTFDAYGEDLLKRFDTIETWTYTTPHNIQRNTPQASSCNNCHGNADLFLTDDKLSADELEANRDVIVNAPPPEITSADQLPYR